MSKIPVGCCALTETGFILEANAAAARLLGLACDELISRPFADFVCADHQEPFARFCGQIQESDEPASCVLEMQKIDGHKIWVTLSGTAQLCATGNTSTLIVINDITSQKNREADLRESSERFQHVIDATRDGIWDWNIPTGHVYFSPQWARLLGYEPEEVPQQVDFFFSLLHPADIERISSILNDHLQGKTLIKQDEIRLRMKSGEYRWFFDRGKVVARDEAGTPIRTVGTISDITRRKEAVAALQESQARTRLLIQAANIGLWDWNLVTNEVYFSPEWKQQLGYADAELACHFDEWMSRLHPDDLESTLAAVSDFRLGNRAAYEIEFRLRHKDESWRWIFARAELVRTSEGVPVRMMGCHFDITDRKRSENALQESEAALREAQAISQIGNFIWNATTGKVKWSDELFRLYGHKSGQFEPTFDTYVAAIHPEDQQRIIDGLQKAMADHSRFDHQYRIALPDGNNRWVRARGVASTHSDGSLAGLEGTCQDISEQKQSEDARDSLEAQLRESQKMEAIGTLAGGIAHDFNNILAAILGNVEIATQELGTGSPVVLNNLEAIQKAGSRARDLVRQILSFSRRQPANRTRITLSKVVEESAQLLRAALPATLTLHIHCSEDAPMVLADATLIEQVLLNLATNSMQAMENRRGTISIQLDRVLITNELVTRNPALATILNHHGGLAARLVLSDDGPGIDATVLPRIFEPFFTTKNVDSGTGLGLSVVHGIVQRHDGVITVESHPACGATFTIYIPAASEQERVEVKKCPDQKNLAAPSTLCDGNILYLDDDDSVSLLVKTLLERRGYRVSCYTDQKEALNALRLAPQKFDVVVTDYSMPGMHGLEVAREVKAIRHDLPVAVTSGFIDEELRQGAKQFGISQLISKPFELEALYETVHQLAQQPKSC